MTRTDIIPENSILFTEKAYDYYDTEESGTPFQVRISFSKDSKFLGEIEVWIAEKIENNPFQSFWMQLEPHEYHAYFLESEDTEDGEARNGRLVILFFVFHEEKKERFLEELEANYLVDQN